MQKIYITGIGGLGNSLFQVAVAVYYKEKFPEIYDDIVISNDENNWIHFGTAKECNKNRCYKRDGVDLSYKYTIFNKFRFDYFDINQIPHQIAAVDFTNQHYIPQPDKNLYIQGFNQHRELYQDTLWKLPEYLNLTDPEIHSALQSKYPMLYDGSKKNIMIGIRAGADFAHMTAVGSTQYQLAIQYIEDTFCKDCNIIVIIDHPEKTAQYMNFPCNGNIIIIDEDDISQIYAGIQCDYFVLSESTYHYWIAALKWVQSPEETKVIYFKDTQTSIYHRNLPNWVELPLHTT